MPRKKPEGTTRTPKATPSVPMIARYLCLAIAELQVLVSEGREAAADKLQLEIEDQLAFRFSGEALMTFRTLIAWVRERQKELASLHAAEFAAVALNTGFAVERGEVIDHE